MEHCRTTSTGRLRISKRASIQGCLVGAAREPPASAEHRFVWSFRERFSAPDFNRDNVFYRVGSQPLKQHENLVEISFLYNSTLDA
jgi:hypothetical protein